MPPLAASTGIARLARQRPFPYAYHYKQSGLPLELPFSTGQEGYMKLVGMLDSPYVRRVAISLQLLGLRFEHQSLSVFRTFSEFQRIYPMVKAPTFIADDGTVLMDSTLILEYAEHCTPKNVNAVDPAIVAACIENHRPSVGGGGQKCAAAL